MERIRNITEYLRSDKKRIEKAIQEVDSFPEPIVVRSADDKNASEMVGLTKQQIAVNKKFPLPHDSTNSCSEKYSILVNDWSPSSEIWTLKNNFTMICCANLLAANYIAFTLRRGYGLKGNTGLINTVFPTTIVSLFFGTVSHHYLVTLKMFRGNDVCEICDELKSAAYQFGGAIVAPIIMGSVSSTYMAWYFNTYAMHDNFFKTKESRRFFYNKIWDTIKRNRRGYLALSVANIVFGYYLADAERQDFLFMYLKLLEREYRNTRKETTN